MDSSLTFCAGGPGSIFAVSKSNVQYSDGFSPSMRLVVRKKMEPDTIICVTQRHHVVSIIMILAIYRENKQVRGMGKSIHLITIRNG